MTTASNVAVGVTGSVYGAPTGSTLATDSTTALDAAFVELGYITDAGIRENQNSATNQIKAWQNGDIVREIQTEHNLTYALDFLESSAEVLEAFYGNETTGTVEITGAQGTRQAWTFNIVDGTTTIRLVIPDGQITDRGEVQYVNGNAIVYPITITCYPDTSGVKAYRYQA